MVFHLQRLSLISLLISSAYGSVFYVGCSQANEQALRSAVDDATGMAVAARDAVNLGKINGAEDVFKAAWTPLMLDNDQLLVSYYFTNLAQARDGARNIRIYCTEDHIHWYTGDNGRTGFWDGDYMSTGNKKETMAIESSEHPNRPGSKPGSDYSYVNGGYKLNDDWDTSNEAHIFIQQSEFGDDPTRDIRSYSDINKDGIKSNFAYMDTIRPKLAKTVFHELTHAVGGRKLTLHCISAPVKAILINNPDSTAVNKQIPRLNVNDGQDTYGWEKCHLRRLAMQSNANIADCLTFLAQAIYIQPQLTSAKKWYWSTGIVDPDTGAPWTPTLTNKRGVNFMSSLTGMTWAA